MVYSEFEAERDIQMSSSARTQTKSPNSQRDRLRVLCILAAILAGLPLFAKAFDTDWVNDVWMINYQTRYLMHHFSFAHTLNTNQIVGLPYPIFYGYLFFPIMGLCSTIFDADMTVRFAALALFVLEALFAYTTLTKLTEDRRFSLVISALLVWAIYPLTNLYHRCALLEFFATGLLTCSLLSWIRALISQHRADMGKWLQRRGALLVWRCRHASDHGNLWHQFFLDRGGRLAPAQAAPSAQGYRRGTLAPGVNFGIVPGAVGNDRRKRHAEAAHRAELPCDRLLCFDYRQSTNAAQPDSDTVSILGPRCQNRKHVY